MNGKILDTNVVIDLFREDEATVSKVKAISKVYLPVIVLGELLYGAKISDRVHYQTAKVNSLAQKTQLLDCDKETASFYSSVKAQLKKAGTPIPENDIWIAALAMQHELPLITNDRHFDKIQAIQKEKIKA